VENANSVNERSMSETREKLKEALNKNAAKTMKDLTPAGNQHIAFQIKLKNPTHEPIACKSRKIAFHRFEKHSTSNHKRKHKCMSI
jgi:hypothetical protein